MFFLKNENIFNIWPVAKTKNSKFLLTNKNSK